MFCFVSVKKIKPGMVEQYREVTRPKELPPGFVWGYNVRDLTDENTIVSIALVDRPVQFFTEQMSDDSDFVKEMQRRAEEMEPLVDEVVVHGVFEVVDELKDEDF